MPVGGGHAGDQTMPNNWHQGKRLVSTKQPYNLQIFG
jgi:hypothetical protein